MRETTKHSYLTKARDDFDNVFFITFCGRHLPDNSESALWIEDFEARWKEQRRAGLCLNCSAEMGLRDANSCEKTKG